MKHLEIDTHEEIKYPEDVKRIGAVLYNKGYMTDEQQCQKIWELYSDSMCAGWMMLPNTDEEIWDCISYYIKN